MSHRQNEIVHLQPEDVLLREGEESTVMYYLNTGSLAIFKRKGNGEQQIGTIYSGELVVIKGEKLEELLDKLPKWYRVLLITLTERLRKANARIKI